jgi:hypothetical protein
MISKRAKAVIARVCLLALALAVATPAAAQKPTFDIEGIVMDAQQGVPAPPHAAKRGERALT